jgi:low affinity Fe/Cu permease
LRELDVVEISADGDIHLHHLPNVQQKCAKRDTGPSPKRLPKAVSAAPDRVAAANDARAEPLRSFVLKLARRAPALVGSSGAFLGTVAITMVWLALGAVYDFSDGWLLVPSAVASIVALLLVVLLQYSQNRDTRALQLKLDEVIRAVGDARTNLLRLEQLPDEELSRIEEDFDRLRDRES